MLASSRVGVSADLVAYFPFDGERLEEEVTGGLAVQGGASFVADGVGSHAIRVERGMEPMTFADGGHLNILDDLTLSAWVKPDTVGDPFQPFLVKSQPGRSAYRLTLRHDGFGLDQGTSLAQAGTGSIGLLAGKWQHLTVTRAGDGRDLGSIVFYLDGVEIGRSESSQAPEAVGFPLSIGERQGNVGAGLSGLLDELRIYHGVLSAEQILALAENAPVESPVLPPVPELPAVGEVRLIHEGFGRFLLAWGGSSEIGFLIQESSDLERWSVIGRVREDRPRLFRIRSRYPRPQQSFYRVVPFVDVAMDR